MTTEITKVLVLADRLGDAKRELEKLAAKARRYGCPDIKVSVGGVVEQKQTVRDWDGEYRRVTVQLVELLIEGEAPRYGNHEFLARIELGEAGNIIDTRPGVEDLDHRFRASNGYCEHCETARRRKEVFVVRNLDTGAQLQIGRNCLRDYLGIDDPAKIAHRFSLLRDARSLEEGFGFGRLPWCASLEGVLSLAAVAIRLFGWCSKTQAGHDHKLIPTVSYVYVGMLPLERVDQPTRETWHKLHDALGEGDRETAQATIRWVREEVAGRSDYEHNLKLLFAEDLVHDDRRLGLVVSAVASYHRAKEKDLRLTRERQQRAASQHVGRKGERLRGLLVTLTDQRTVNENQWGSIVLIKFRDEQGNILTWFTGRGSGLSTGEQCRLDGTVKDHSEYNGAMETQLTRCALSPVGESTK